MARKSRVNPETPSAVRAASDKAAELHKQLYGSPEPDTTEEATQEDAALGDDDSAKGGDIQPVEAQGQKDSAADTAQPASPPKKEPVTPSDPPPEKPAVDWEDKYKTLQGKYNAEVPRLNAELRDLRKQVEQLLDAQKTPQKTEEAAPADDPIVSEQDLVDYGDDLVDLIRRVAKAEAAQKTKELTPKIEQIEGRFQETQAQQANNSVYSKLDAQVEDWKEINKSPEFVGWLQDRDPYAGAVRQDLLTDAFAAGDGDRVVAFFKGFLAEQQTVAPPAAQQHTEKPQVRLEELAGPAAGTSGAAQPATQDATPSWTRAQIASFYKDVQLGKYKHNPQRKAQIEASIAAALSKGAVA